MDDSIIVGGVSTGEGRRRRTVKDRFGSYAIGFFGLVAFAAVGLLVTLQILREEAVARAVAQHGVAVR